MPIASLRQVEKSFGVRRVLDGVNLTVLTGERVGLVGNNGSGKTTLARILAGLDHPDAGEVILRRDAAIAYLDQEPRLPPGQSALEVVLGGLGPWSAARARYDEATRGLERAGPHALEALVTEQAAAAAEIERCGGWARAAEAEGYLARLGVRDPAALTEHMSGGERRRVALATLLARRPDLAVLDEPTNHLDVAAIEWLERHLAEDYPGAVLLITHDRYILDRVCTRTLEVDRGTIYAYDGGFGAYLEAKAERTAHQQRTEGNRQNFLRRELEWLRRQPKARSTKQQARVRRAETELGKAPPPRERRVDMSLETAESGKTILELRGITLELGRVLVRDFTLRLNPGERIGVVGPNGIGKTTLLRAITGQLAPVAGDIVRGKHTALAYLDQTRSGLDDTRTVYDNIAERRRGADLGGHPLDIAKYLERFLFDPSTYAQKVGSLSGGERARVALAVLLSGAANLVLLDEPTNDLDIATLGAVEEMLLDFSGAAIIVTHDRWFLDRVATSILAFEGDGKLVRHHGNYTDYVDRIADTSAAAEPQPSARPAAARPATGSAAKRGLSFAERKELDGIMGAIDDAEREVQELTASLGDPAVYSRGGDAVQELVRRLDAARQRAAALVARWEELERRKAEAGP